MTEPERVEPVGILREPYELAGTLIALFGLGRGIFAAFRHATVDQREPLITITLSLGLAVLLLFRRLRTLEKYLAAEPRLSLYFDPADPHCVRSEGIWTRFFIGILNSGRSRAR